MQKSKILGLDGKPLTKPRASSSILGSGFDGASQGRRMKNYKPPSAAVNALLMSSLEHLRNRSRDQVRNIPWMKKADRAYSSNVVGNGIRPIPQTDDEAFNEAVKEAWDEWCYEADADGRNSFYGLQALATRSIYQSGEVLVRMVERPTDDFDLLVPFQVKLLESDHLDHTHTLTTPDGNKIIQGVEFDEYDRVVAFHLWREHPSEMLGIRHASQRIRIDASEVLHVFESQRPGQVRGYPAVASAIVRMMDMMEYEDAEVVRKKIAAFLTLFIKSTADADRDLLDEQLNAAAEADLDGDGTAGGSEPLVTDIEPGTGIYLDPGQEIQIAESADVGSNYEPFLKMNLRAAAAGSDVMYEQMTGDLSSVNFSSIRWGLNEMQRVWEQFQNHILVHQLCQPVYRRFIDHAVRTGVLQAKDYLYMPRKYMKVSWLAPGWPYVNPQQEANADLVSLRGGVSSRTRVAARRGYDVRELDREIKADNDRADSEGFVFDSDPRKVNKSGAPSIHKTEPEPSSPDENSAASELDTENTE